jgi:hypothetical protein
MNTPNLFGSDFEQTHQQRRLDESTWEGASVISMIGTLDEIYRSLPVFSRHPFRSGGEENRYKDEIRREPLKIDDSTIPVATVTKTYSLIQHRDVLASIYHALKLLHLEVAALESSLVMSEYGERMQWSCQLPNFDFDPGDGCPLVLQMNCLNSVDMSTSLEVTLSWFRLVCSNGLMFGMGDSRLRKRHIQSLDPEDVAAYIRNQIAQVEQEQSMYRQWMQERLTLEDAAKWADTVVSKEWGLHAAARVWNVIRFGEDGEVVASKQKRLAHEQELTSTTAVPGAPVPTENLFHASQALSWIAGTRKNVQDRLQYIKDIPVLMKPLAERSL